MEGDPMATSDADDPTADFERRGLSLRESIEEQIRVRGIRPIRSVEDLLCDVWESDEELDEFLADLAISRHSYLA
jgi:hypothetical protein